MRVVASADVVGGDRGSFRVLEVVSLAVDGGRSRVRIGKELPQRDTEQGTRQTM